MSEVITQASAARYTSCMASEKDPLETLRARLYAPKPVETVLPDTLSQHQAGAPTATPETETAEG